MNENNKSLLDNDNVSSHLLQLSNTLSWDEKQLIEYIRKHPEEKEKIIELLKK